MDVVIVQPGKQRAAVGVDGHVGRRDRRRDVGDAAVGAAHVDEPPGDLGAPEPHGAHTPTSRRNRAVSRPAGAALPTARRARGAATGPDHRLSRRRSHRAPRGHTRHRDVDDPSTSGSEAVECGDGGHHAGKRISDRIGDEHRTAIVRGDQSPGHRGIVAEGDAPGTLTVAAVAGDRHPHRAALGDLVHIDAELRHGSRSRGVDHHVGGPHDGAQTVGFIRQVEHDGLLPGVEEVVERRRAAPSTVESRCALDLDDPRAGARQDVPAQWSRPQGRQVDDQRVAHAAPRRPRAVTLPAHGRARGRRLAESPAREPEQCSCLDQLAGIGGLDPARHVDRSPATPERARRRPGEAARPPSRHHGQAGGGLIRRSSCDRGVSVQRWPTARRAVRRRRARRVSPAQRSGQPARPPGCAAPASAIAGAATAPRCRSVPSRRRLPTGRRRPPRSACRTAGGAVCPPSPRRS